MHDKQSEEPKEEEDENFPAGQGVHEDAPGPEWVPIGHSVQVDSPPVAYEPASQGSAIPAMHLDPEGQGRQDEDEAEGEYEPSGHVVQLDAPPREYFPGTQEKQSTEPRVREEE